MATPNLAFTLRRPGEYRIEVDPGDDATAVIVTSGDAEVYGEGASYSVRPGRAYRFYGNDLSDYEILTARSNDELDRWSRERDRRGDRSLSARYVSSDVVGYEDLDANGSWRVDSDYGPVWTPNRVAAGWTPYRDGHWSWVDPWGWTWVDDAPWGYAVSHYGRWAHIDRSWAWVPGPRCECAVYAPALVAFVDGDNFQLSVTAGSANGAAVGWFPLAPREVYRPSYAVSRDYFVNINRSNAALAPQALTQVYNTTIVNNSTAIVKQQVHVIYANQQVTGAVLAVPRQAFVQSQPVARALVPLSRQLALSAPVVHVASVAPSQQSVQGGAREADARPPAREHRIVARTAPPPPPVPFAAQQQQLATHPGTPIDDTLRTQIKPAGAPAATAKVNVVATAPAPTAAAVPLVAPAIARSTLERRSTAASANATRDEPREPRKLPQDAAAAQAATAARADAVRSGGALAEAAKLEAARQASDRADASKADAGRAEAVRAEAIKSAAARAALPKAEPTQGDAARAEAAKAALVRQSAAASSPRSAASGRADGSSEAAADDERKKARDEGRRR